MWVNFKKKPHQFMAKFIKDGRRIFSTCENKRVAATALFCQGLASPVSVIKICYCGKKVINMNKNHFSKKHQTFAQIQIHFNTILKRISPSRNSYIIISWKDQYKNELVDVARMLFCLDFAKCRRCWNLLQTDRFEKCPPTNLSKMQN